MSISPKPGITTSEFWQSLLVQIVSAVAGLGTLVHARFDLSGLQVLIPSISVLAAAIASAFYSRARSTEKAARAANATRP